MKKNLVHLLLWVIVSFWGLAACSTPTVETELPAAQKQLQFIEFYSPQ